MKKTIALITKFTSGLNRHHIDTYAAATAFFFFICFMPFLMLVASLIPYTPIEKTIFIDIINSVLPVNGRELAFGIIDELFEVKTSLLSFSILTLLWTSSRTVVSIRKGLNDIDGTLEETNFLIVRLLASAFMILLIVLLGLISFVSIFGSSLNNFLISKNIRVFRFIAVVFDHGTFITLFSFFVIFTIIYALLPASRHHFLKIMPGAFFSSVACLLFSKIFNYVSINYLSFSMYGSLATIIILMIYFNLFFYFFFIGAYLNKFLKERS